MNFYKKDVMVGLVIVLIIISGAYLYRYLKKPRIQKITPSPASYEFKKDFEESFQLDIPDNVNSIELKDVSGGNSRGIATDNEILVDADDPEAGFYYEAWLEKESGLISLGKLRFAKGGWLIEYDRSKNPTFTKVIVSLEKENDNNLEKRILEGSF